MHDHAHDHSHSHGKDAPYKVLMLAIVLTLSFAVVEIIGGWLTGSLALLGDGGHMSTDSLALGIAAFAAWIAQKPPSYKHSYGLGRAEVVAAWLSSLLMLVISVAIIVEAVRRIHAPEHVAGGPVMLIAFIGLLVNLFIAWLLSRGERTINVRAAMLHVLGDLLGSVAALISGAVIFFTHWTPIDPILSIFIGLLILVSSFRLLRESLQILMEGVPRHLDIQDVSARMVDIEGVKDIHDLHIWTLSSGSFALSAHIEIHELSSWQTVLESLMKMLKNQYAIDHVTLQPEPDLIDCQPCNEPGAQDKLR